jgi:glycosyltransferase involved in cell wall biosynthesis
VKQKETPLVSIVIPTYNRENTIVDSIKCALNQTYSNIEVIIVDNNSSDTTLEIINDSFHDSRLIVIKNEENIGPVKNWQKGIKKSRGRYLKILFSDDLISKNFIEDSIKLIHDDVAFVITPIEIFKKNLKNTISWSKYDNLKTISKFLYLLNILIYNKLKFPVSPGAALFRKKDIINTLEKNMQNKFNIDFNRTGAGPDLNLYLYTVLNYRKIAINNNSKSYFRSHKDSITISNNLILEYETSKMLFAKKNLHPVFMLLLDLKIYIKGLYNNL